MRAARVKATDLYVTDRSGWLYRMDARTGRTLWERRISEYNGISGSFSRSRPAIQGRRLYLGDRTPAVVPNRIAEGRCPLRPNHGHRGVPAWYLKRPRCQGVALLPQRL